MDGETSTAMTRTRTQMTRRRLLKVGAGIAMATALPSRAMALGAAGGVPTFLEVTGQPLGLKRASTGQIEKYLRAVAAATPRVWAGDLPTPTIEGRSMPYAMVSAPQNLERVEEIAARLRALRDEPGDAAAAAQAAAELPAFVHVFGNVHGNEPSGADGMLQVLYDLASRVDPANEQRLSELIVVMLPTQNPDGREGYHRTNAHGFDLNRDWFAHTQPETPDKFSLYVKYPPILGMDLHEQFFSPPWSFWFPPNNDPIHHEVSRSGLAAVNQTFSPAVESAFDSRGFQYDHYGSYDVFAPIYGDTIPEQAFGAAGVLFEMENETVYASKYEHMYVGIDAAVTAAAQNKRALLGEWAQQWAPAAAEGREGSLLPNFVQGPEAGSATPIPAERVYGYAFEPEPHGADLAHLVDRLRAFGVRVYETRKATKTTALRPVGGSAFGSAALPARSVVVPAGQPMKRLIHMLLEDDPHAAAPYFYDVSGWSNPALMGLSGGALGQPLDEVFGSGEPPRLLREIDSGAAMRPRRTPQRSSVYAFAADSARSQAAIFALLRQGVSVRRTAEAHGKLPAGSAVVPGGARSVLLAATEEFGLSPVGLGSRPETVAARRPRVALIHDRLSDAFQYYFARSSGFAQWLLETRFGLDVELIYADQLRTGTLTAGGFDALVVPNGFSTVIPGGYPNIDISFPAAATGLLGLLELRRFVARGGTYLGWCQQGISLARAAGLAPGLRTVTASLDYVVPGCPFPVKLHGGDPATVGLEGPSYVFNVRDPVLKGGETTIASYPDQVRPLGYAEGVEEVAGTVAASATRVGSGRAYVTAFDPAYRGWVEAAQRLVGNVLLTPPPGPGGREPADVDLGLLKSAKGFERRVLIRVAGGAVVALRQALAGASAVPAQAAVVDGPGGSVQVEAPDAEPLSGHTAGWIRETLQALATAGVTPTLVVA